MILNGDKVQINLTNLNDLSNIPLFMVIDWDIITPEATINLDFILKSLEGNLEIDFIEEITQEEYNNLRNEL